jgi:hypothetical protein
MTMTKEKLIILNELADKECARTLTPAEAETLEEIRQQSKAEMDYWLAEGDVEALRAHCLEMGKVMMEQNEDKYLAMAGELMLAGWKFEYAYVNPPGYEHRAMSWYWRRPPRRKGSKGMLFRSTDQAYRHMQKGNE